MMIFLSFTFPLLIESVEIQGAMGIWKGVPNGPKWPVIGLALRLLMID